jgi:hypothetical protein
METTGSFSHGNSSFPVQVFAAPGLLRVTNSLHKPTYLEFKAVLEH